MKLIERYIFRMVAGAFMVALLMLTGVVWVTQALREIDLVTSQGQTLRLFFYVTLLALPALIMVIAPIALFIACLFALNKLNGDSELVVVNAAGMPQWHIIKPFLLLGVIVTLLTATIGIVVMPESARKLRDLTTQIRADLLSYVIVDGQFTQVEQGLTFHVRERQTDGTLRGVHIRDGRSADQTRTYIAEEGYIIRQGQNAFLMMRNGNINQIGDDPQRTSIITYDRYVFDLSSLTRRTGVAHRHPRELSILELRQPDPNNIYYQRSPGRFRAEFHDRLSAPLYPLAFVFIALAALGRPRTNRTGRGEYLLAAVAAMVSLRALGFGMTNLAASQAWAVAMMYGAPLLVTAIAIWLALSERANAMVLSFRLPPAVARRADAAMRTVAQLPSALGPRHQG